MKNPLAETIITRTHLLIATQNYLYFFNPTTIAAAKYNAKHTLLTFGSSCMSFNSFGIPQSKSTVSVPMSAVSLLTHTVFAVQKPLSCGEPRS